MEIIWFLNFFEKSGGTKNSENRKKVVFFALFQLFVKFFGVFTPDGQRKSCSSWKMLAFWHHDDHIFRNPVGVPGCLFLLSRFYTGNFAFLSKKNFFWYPEKNFFTRNIGHAASYRLVSWSTDFSTWGVFKIAKWWKSTFCQFFFLFLSTWFPEHRNFLSKNFFYKNVSRTL